MAEIRLQKLLADRGVASRRAAEELIAKGKVTVNGQIIKEMGFKVNATQDKITVNGNPLPAPPALRYILLNKPVGYLCSAKDERDKKSVLHLLPEGLTERLYPVGRLDYNTSGLLLLTNDGALTNALLHPSRQVTKLYVAEIYGPISGNDLDKLAKGVELEDGLTAPAEVELMRRGKTSSLISLTIHEGRNHQVRRMCEAIGHKVIRLKRLRFASLSLGNLKEGQTRELRPAEIKQLKQIAESGAAKTGKNFKGKTTNSLNVKRKR